MIFVKNKTEKRVSIESEYFGADSKLFQVYAKSETQIGCKKNKKGKKDSPLRLR